MPSRKRKLEDIEFTPQEQQNIRDINPGKFESNLKSCLIRLKKNKNITRFCRKILYLTGMSSPSKSYEFNYSLSQYSKLQNNLGKVITILYLLYKNSEDCFVFNKPLNSSLDFLNLDSNDITNPTDVVSFLFIDLEENKTYTPFTSFPPNFKQKIKKCDNKRFTLMFLAHEFIMFHKHEDLLDIFKEFQKKKKYKKSYKNALGDFKFYKFCKKYKHVEGHQNAIIFDNKNKTIERCEPHGSQSNYNMSDYDQGLVSALMKVLGVNSMAFYTQHPKGHPDTKYTYISPIDFCPADGFQVIEQDDPLNTKLDFEGYCYMWSVFYMEMRMTKPDIPRNTLIEKTIEVINSSTFSFKDYIYDYIYFHSFIINSVENLLTKYKNKSGFKFIPKKFIYLVITTKIKELAKNYSESIFEHDVSINNSKKTTHLTSLKNYVNEKISNIILTKNEIDPEIKRKFLLPIAFKSTPPPTKKIKLSKKVYKGGKKMRKHSGINQQTGRLKKGYKYSGKLKSGLSRIIKVTKVKKGGATNTKIKQKGKYENTYQDCNVVGCRAPQMKHCCAYGTKAQGYCRVHKDQCSDVGMSMSKRKGNVSKEKLADLRKNMKPKKKPKTKKIGRFTIEEDF